MEVTFSSVEFNADIFAMANNETFVLKDAYNPVTVIAAVEDGYKIYIKDKNLTVTDAQSDEHGIRIAGLKDLSDYKKPAGSTETEPTSGTSGYMSIAAYTNTVGSNSLHLGVVITVSSSDFDLKDLVLVYYEQKISMKVAEFDNKKSAFGEVILKYPIYAGGDEDSLSKNADGGGIKGYVIMDIYRARATTMPGFDSNYKNTVENSITFSTMDPSKAQNKNGKVYDVRYFDLANSTGVK